MNRNYSDRIIPWIDKAVAIHGGEDRVAFEVMFSFGSAGPGQPVGFHGLLVLTMPSPLVGQHIFHVAQFVPFTATEDSLATAVREGVEAMRKSRSDQLAGQN